MLSIVSLFFLFYKLYQGLVILFYFFKNKVEEYNLITWFFFLILPTVMYKVQ